MGRTKFLLLTIAAVWLMASSLAHAYLLDEYFGVNPTVSPYSYAYTTNDGNTGTYDSYRFDAGSFSPTRHGATADYQVNDWFGYWDNTLGRYSSAPGAGDYPSGEEPYDTEAYYFDDDGTNLYFAIVAGFPSPATGIYSETRADPDIPVVQGDFALDIPGGHGQTDNWGFSYDYGVNLTNEARPASGNVTSLYSNTLGNEVYQTTNGWYLGTPSGAVNPVPGNRSGSFTNFDPSYNGGAGMTNVGAATTNWYQLALPNQENNWNTYVIEITIPRAIIPGLRPGDALQYHWLMGCRNDGDNAVAYMTGSGDIDTPEPGTLALMLVASGPLGLWIRRRRKDKQS
jgi:hypothetical protein